MAWLMSLHIVTLGVWCAGLLYLPGLLGVESRDHKGDEHRRMRVITRLTYLGIASPAAVLAIISGSVLAYATNATGDWFAAKLTFVAFMGFFHAYCGYMLAVLGHESGEKRRRRFKSWLVVVPVVLIAVVLWLVLAKPQLFPESQVPIW